MYVLATRVSALLSSNGYLNSSKRSANSYVHLLGHHKALNFARTMFLWTFCDSQNKEMIFLHGIYWLVCVTGTKCEVGSEYLSIIHLDFKRQFFPISGGILSHITARYFPPKCIITIIKRHYGVPFNRCYLNRTYIILSHADLPQHCLVIIVCSSVAYKKKHYE